MVGGEAVPKTGAEVGAKVEFDAKAVPQPGCTAGDAPSASVTDSKPVDVFDYALKQSVLETEPATKPGYNKFASMTSEIEISLNIVELDPKEFLEGKKNSFEGAAKEAFELLFEQNAKVAAGEKASAIKLENAYEAAMKQFREIDVTADLYGKPVESLPNAVRACIASKLSPKDIPDGYRFVMSADGQLAVAEDVAGKLTPEKVAEIELKIAKGEIPAMEAAKEPLRARLKGAAVEVGAGGAAFAGSLAMAHAIGFENPLSHLGFIIYSMEAEVLGGNLVKNVVAAKMSGATMGEAWAASSASKLFGGGSIGARFSTFVRRGIVDPPKNMLHIGPGLLWSHFGAQAVMAYGAIEAEITGRDPEEVKEELGDVSMYASLGSFFVPTVLARILGGGSAAGVGLTAAGEATLAALLIELGISGIGNLVSDDFEYAMYHVKRLAKLDREETEDALFEKLSHTSGAAHGAMWGGMFVAKTVEDFVNVFLPTVMDVGRAANYRMRHFGNPFSDNNGEEEFFVEDYKEAKKSREGLPHRFRAVLSGGVDGEYDNPEFYDEVNLDWMGKTLLLEDNTIAKLYDEKLQEYLKSPEYRRLKGGERAEALEEFKQGVVASPWLLKKTESFISARDAQKQLIGLHVIDQVEGDPIRELVNRDGTIVEGKEDEFMMEYVAPAFDDLGADATADDVRARILENRKAALVRRVLAAEATLDGLKEQKPADRAEEVDLVTKTLMAEEEVAKLTELAHEVGLADGEGRLIDTPAYREAITAMLHEKVFANDEESDEILTSHLKSNFDETMELAEKPELSADEAERLEFLKGTEVWFHGQNAKERAARDEKLRMETAEIILNKFAEEVKGDGGISWKHVMERKTEFSANWIGEIDELGLTAEEREKVDAAVEYICKYPKPDSELYASSFSIEAGHWVVSK